MAWSRRVGCVRLGAQEDALQTHLRCRWLLLAPRPSDPRRMACGLEDVEGVGARERDSAASPSGVSCRPTRRRERGLRTDLGDKLRAPAGPGRCVGHARTRPPAACRYAEAGEADPG